MSKNIVRRLKVRRLLRLSLIAIAVAALALASSQVSTKNTEAQAAPEMHLVLPEGNCTGTPGGGTADGNGNATPSMKCTRIIGEKFHVQVQGTAANVGGFRSEVFGLPNDGAMLANSKGCPTEVTMTPLANCSTLPNPNGYGEMVHSNRTGPNPPFPAWGNPPNLVDMPNVTCTRAGRFKLVLSAQSAAPNPPTPNGSKFIDANGNDIQIKTRGNLNFSNPPQPFPIPGGSRPVADVVEVNCVTTKPVGGISLDPGAGALPLQSQPSSGSDAWLLAGAVAGAMAVIVMTGGGVWYARRRRVQ